MSPSHYCHGQVGTGEFTNAWAEELRDLIASNPTPIAVADPGTSHGRQLIEALGATYVPMFRGVPESEYAKRSKHVRARLRAQGIKDCTPGRERSSLAEGAA